MLLLIFVSNNFVQRMLSIYIGSSAAKSDSKCRTNKMCKFNPFLVFVVIFAFILPQEVEATSKEIEFDPKQTKVYGPGLVPHKVILPVRYFFIEAYDTEGKRITKSLGDRVKVWIEGQTTSGLNCRVWVQVLDRHDGSYIVRYRTFQTCHKTKIQVLYNYRDIGDSPYVYDEPVYADDCSCPLENIPTWAQLLNCSQSYPQIQNDLSRFDEVDMDEIFKEVVEKYHQPKARSFCHYVLSNNAVYRRCYGKYVGFSMFMDNILNSLVRKMKMPDLEFFVNLGDWPFSSKNEKKILPIFSWCNSEDSADIIMPTYDLTESTLEMMGRVTLDVFSAQSNNKIPWSEKKSVAFWRGRDSRRERLDLITIGRKHPEMLNVSLTNFFFFREEEEKYGPKSPHESFFNFFNYKYQIAIDGTVASYRLPYLLAGSGVVLKQDSEFYEHFYKDLKPYIHYIPFKSDLSDLVDQVQWAMDHDEESRTISRNAREFVQKNLLPKDIFCYHALLFLEWSKKLKSPVRVREGMESVPNNINEQRLGDCNCRLKAAHEEL